MSKDKMDSCKKLWISHHWRFLSNQVTKCLPDKNRAEKIHALERGKQMVGNAGRDEFYGPSLPKILKVIYFILFFVQWRNNHIYLYNYWHQQQFLPEAWAFVNWSSVAASELVNSVERTHWSGWRLAEGNKMSHI